MDDFLSKPIRAADLSAAIDRIVGARPPVELARPALLDPRMLWDVCGGDAGVLEKISQAFRARVPGHLAAVRDALREHDSLGLRAAAHKLRGMVVVFSSVAGAIASDLEEHASQGQLEEARPIVEQLETMTEELMRVTTGLSLETLRHQAQVTNGPEPNASP